MMRVTKHRLGSGLALIAALAVIVGSARTAEADDSVTDAPPFPYAELAALAAAETPKRVSVPEQVVVRLRPGYGWAGVAVMEAGEVAIAEATTVEYSSWAWKNDWHRGLVQIWMRVVLADGATGWIPSQKAALSQALWARLRTESYEPLTARWVGTEQSTLRAWPDGPPVSEQSSTIEGTYGVFGRSQDGVWIALRDPEPNAAVVWAPISEVELFENGVTFADLPIFVGTETTVLPLGEPDGRRPHSIQPATEWRWTSDQRIVAVGEDTFWRYDPETQVEHSVPRPPGRYELSPDGRLLAVEVESPPDREEQWFNDLAFVELNTGEVTEFADVHYVFSLDFGSWIGDWSQDSRSFLAPRWAPRGMEFSVLSTTGKRYDLPWFPIGRWSPWRWQSDNRLIHEGWDVISVVNRDGSNLQETQSSRLSAAEQYDWWPVAQRLCDLPPGDYPALGIAYAPFDVPDGVVGEERERIRDCASIQTWEVDRGHTILHFVSTGALLLFHAPSGETVELTPRESSVDYIWQRATVLPSPSGQRAIFHRGQIPVGLGMPHLFEFSPLQRTELPLAYGQVCGRHWNWSPDETQFAVEVNLTDDFNSRFGLDGLAANARSPRHYYRVSQVRILDRAGELIRTWRTLGSDRSVMEAKWSPDGRWLAFGGHRDEWCNPGH